MLDWVKEIKNEDNEYNHTLSFEDYMETFHRMPKRELRTSAEYLKSMFDHYGKNEGGGFNLF
jgi:hypothetical protein